MAVVWSRGKRRAKKRSIVPPARQPTRRPGARKISKKTSRMFAIVCDPLHDSRLLCLGRDRLHVVEKYDSSLHHVAYPITPCGHSQHPASAKILAEQREMLFFCLGKSTLCSACHRVQSTQIRKRALYTNGLYRLPQCAHSTIEICIQTCPHVRRQLQ